jgi:hypothetical protein
MMQDRMRRRREQREHSLLQLEEEVAQKLKLLASYQKENDTLK